LEFLDSHKTQVQMTTNSPDDMNIHREDLDNEDRCDKIIQYKFAPLRARIGSLISVDSETKVRQSALDAFDSVFSPTKKNLQDWISEFRSSLESAKEEFSGVKAERDSVPSDLRSSIERVVPMTASEKFEYYLLMTGAIILWVVGYLSAVQVIKSVEAAITPLGVWLLPLAGVTVMGLLIKILLSRLQGTKTFNILLLTLIAVGLTASLFWLFTFSEFVKVNGAAGSFGGLGAQASNDAGASHNSMLYIIVSVLGETIGASACYAYASSIKDAKTIWSMEPNPQWRTKDDKMQKIALERSGFDNVVSNCIQLNASIDALRGTFLNEVIAAYESKRDAKLDREADGGSPTS